MESQEIRGEKAEITKYQLRMLPEVQAELTDLCNKTHRSIHSLCLHLLSRSMQNPPSKYPKLKHRTPPDAYRFTLRLPSDVHETISRLSKGRHSMNNEFNSRLYVEIMALKHEQSLAMKPAGDVSDAILLDMLPGHLADWLTGEADRNCNSISGTLVRLLGDLHKQRMDCPSPK